MSSDTTGRACPDCGEAVAFTFMDTSGVGAQKRGDGYNATPDTAHYICFPCRKTWKQRAGGPLTPDIVGEIAFFSCRREGCGSALTLTRESAVATDNELACPQGHRYGVVATGDGGLRLDDQE
jgi:hypothetical protein